MSMKTVLLVRASANAPMLKFASYRVLLHVAIPLLHSSRITLFSSDAAQYSPFVSFLYQDPCLWPVVQIPDRLGIF
jgi:hypothetical protein